jgi:diguanylate cyclase (GGDEF)-like protein/PAS domain S-box-containing protein
MKRLNLSPQEEKVLTYSVEGFSDKQIAHQLGISLDTVRTYWQRIRSKIGAGTRAEIVARFNRDVNADLADEVSRVRDVKQRLRESQARYRSAIESTSDCFFMMDAVRDAEGRIVDFRYAEVNARAAAFVGRPEEKLVDLTLLTTFEDGRLAPFVAAYARVVETGEVYEQELETNGPSHSCYILRAGRVGDGVAVNLRDVTALKAQQRLLEDQNEELRRLSEEREEVTAKALADHEFLEAVLGNMDCLVCVLDREGRVVRFNTAAERLSGWLSSEVVGKVAWDMVIPVEERETVRNACMDLTAGHFPNTFENHWISRTGERRFIAFHNTCITDERGDVKFIVSTGIDATDRRKVEAEARKTNERLELAQRIAGVGSWEMDFEGGNVRWSDQMYVLFGYQPGTVSASFEAVLRRMPEQDVNKVRAAIRKCVENRIDVEFKHRVVLPSGEVRVIQTLCHPLPDEHRLVGTTLDVTDREHWEQEVEAAMLRTVEESVQLEIQRHELALMNEKLTHLATTDGLTGVANHRTFQERLDEMMLACRRTQRPMSLVLLDVDRFKMFNDDYGHQAGDAVLRGVAAALSAVCRTGDLVARYGGEEFAVLLRDADATVARCVVERLRKAIEGHHWEFRTVTASFGVATLTESVSREELIERADRALYASKGAGRNRYTHADDVIAPGVAIVGVCEPSPSSS